MMANSTYVYLFQLKQILNSSNISHEINNNDSLNKCDNNAQRILKNIIDDKA